MKNYLIGMLLLMGNGQFLAVSTKSMPSMPMEKSVSGLSNIKEIFLHRSRQDSLHIEIGNLVLYLDQRVKDKHTTTMLGDLESHSFFLPAQMTPRAIAMWQEILPTIPSQYKISFESISKPEKGVRITITFDAKKIGLRLGRFDSIGMQQAIAFRLYNKDSLEIIKANNEIIKTASYTPSSIVIDCGHGGIDSGAVFNNLKEKDIALQVGMYLSQELQKSGYVVYLSRDKDVTVELYNRTTFANYKNADLFVSIHLNAGGKDSCGIETYALDPNLISNQMTTLSEHENMLVQQYLKEKYKKSDMLAHAVQTNLINTLSSKGVINRHVRHKVAQVLLGTTMPSILVEVGFLTHEREAQLLSDASYQKMIAAGITHGILSYLGRC